MSGKTLVSLFFASLLVLLIVGFVMQGLYQTAMQEQATREVPELLDDTAVAADAMVEKMAHHTDTDAITDAAHAPPIETTETPLSIGTKAPDFTLPNADGEAVTLYDALENGAVILSFYRGGWCPYCNDQLYAYQQILPEFMELGAQLIAVSPEKPEGAKDTAMKNELAFEVLSDDNNHVARQYNLMWTVPEDQREKFSAWLKNETGKTLADINGHDSYELPVPATFVIAQDGTIAYVFKDEDYKKRADTNDILDALENLDLAR